MWPSSCSLPQLLSHHFFKVCCSVMQLMYIIAGDSEWNIWLVQLYNSTYINQLCVRCIRHELLCGRSLHWLAQDSHCALLPQWQATGSKSMPFYWWLNVRLMTTDLVIIIKLQEFKCCTIKQHLWFVTNHVIPTSCAWCIYCWDDLHTPPSTLMDSMSTNGE